MSAAILVVDDERAIGIAIQRLLTGRGYEVDTALSRWRTRSRSSARRTYHLVITDLNLQGTSRAWTSSAAVQAAASRHRRRDDHRLRLGEDRRRGDEGAAPPTTSPSPSTTTSSSWWSSGRSEGVALRRDLQRLREQVAERVPASSSSLGKSAAMQRVFDVIRKVAGTDLTVLIRGPSGTGKELVGERHPLPEPASQPTAFVKVNCAAFSRELVESELFGHEKGAFTGATATREGKFETADGGTPLLDEIGDMALETQAKISARAQEQELERVGGNRTLKVDVRVLAATNQDLEAEGPRRFVSPGPVLPPERGVRLRSRRCASALTTCRS